MEIDGLKTRPRSPRRMLTALLLSHACIGIIFPRCSLDDLHLRRGLGGFNLSKGLLLVDMPLFSPVFLYDQRSIRHTVVN